MCMKEKCSRQNRVVHPIFIRYNFYVIPLIVTSLKLLGFVKGLVTGNRF